MDCQELYVVCQIEDFSLKIMVNQYINGQIQVLYKECINNEQFAENGVVINPVLVGGILKSIIEKINKALNIKVKRITLSLPSYNLKIYQSKATLDFKDSQHLVTANDCNKLVEMAKLINIDTNEMICLTKPYNFRIDNFECKEQFPIGFKGQFFNVEALVYSLPKMLYDSQIAVLQAANCDLLTLTLEQFALVCNIDEQTANSKVILIDWGISDTKISAFINSVLYSTTTIKIGFNQIVQELMTKMRCGYDKAEKYLLKILNINSNYLSDFVISQYCDASSKRLVHLTKADLQETVRTKINEVINFINYFLNDISGQENGMQVIFTGITTSLPGFMNYIKNYNNMAKVKFLINQIPGINSFEWLILIGITRYQHLINDFNKKMLSSISEEEIIKETKNMNKDNNYDTQKYNLPLHPNYQYNGN